MTDDSTPKANDQDAALEAALNELGEAERASPDAGIAARIARATAPALPDTRSNAPTVRLVHPPTGQQRSHRRLKIATGLAAAAAVAVFALITLPQRTPSPAGTDRALADAAAANIDDEVTYMLAAMDVWDTEIDSEVDLVLADAVGVATSLDAADANWADSWISQGDL